MLINQANGSTMVMFLLGLAVEAPSFVVGPLFYPDAKGMCKTRYVFAFLCLWMGLSTFQEFLGRKGMFLCFYVFMFSESKPVDMA
jgi:hypothetical protein